MYCDVVGIFLGIVSVYVLYFSAVYRGGEYHKCRLQGLYHRYLSCGIQLSADSYTNDIFCGDRSGSDQCDSGGGIAAGVEAGTKDVPVEIMKIMEKV